jgi:uncharacterized phage-associated protein
MAYRAVQIANEFLRQPGAAGALTQMQLQKLAYLANGWNWAINGDALIADPVEAWDYGPVYRDLYEHTRLFGKAPIARPVTPDDRDAARVFGIRPRKAAPAFTATLTDRERAVIQHVWRRYGDLSGARLSALTHQPGTPWFQSYAQGRNATIEQPLIRAHFDRLARRAEQGSPEQNPEQNAA